MQSAFQVFSDIKVKWSGVHIVYITHNLKKGDIWVFNLLHMRKLEFILDSRVNSSGGKKIISY